MLLSKNAKICIPPDANFKMCVTPTQNPNASQWNIGCVGSQTQISGIGYVHFIIFGVDFIRVRSRFPVEYGLK